MLSVANLATPHPKVDIPKTWTIDQKADKLEALWEERMQDDYKSVIGIPVQRTWQPLDPIDDVLEIADAIMDSGGMPRLIYPQGPKKATDGTYFPGGIDVHPKFYGEK